MAPETKRLRENTSTDLKKDRPNETLSTTLIELVEQKFAEQTASITATITASIQKSEDRILQEMHEKVNVMSGKIEELTQRVHQLEKEVAVVEKLKERMMQLEAETQDAQTLGGRVGEIEARVATQANESIAADLRVHGVPYQDNENLKSLFHTLCFNLKLTPPPRIREAFRISPRRPNPTVDPIIIIKFEHVRDKAAILRAAGAYRREFKQPLTLQLLGMNSPAAVYLNEQLSRENYEIFREARRLKRLKRLFWVFTRRGIVHVTQCVGAEVMCVESMQKLYDL
ncbi:uncharacterized protein [Drosophila takahashii]|uniref:uncharacterized protein n=1 Tax=Drosophila takahashii TaxID=29030 RepID=UPI00389901BD